MNHRPVLKWPGGKFRLRALINDILPRGKVFVEPFVGSGAVFLNTEFTHYWLNDANQDLIDFYRVLQHQQEDFIQYCRRFFKPQYNQEKKYYECRERFNSATDITEKAVLLLYLNRHCYNGLIRYNRSGRFNVPFGRYVKPYFPQRELEYMMHKIQHAQFFCGSFETLMTALPEQAVVYCDPPYIPLSKTACFTSYHQHAFTYRHHEQLALLAERIAQQGIPVVISNHDTPVTRRLYQEATYIVKLTVRRQISCQKRRAVPELLAIYSDQ